MLIGAGLFGPVIVLLPAALVVAVLWLVARALSQSSGERLASLVLGGLSTMLATVELVKRLNDDAWYGTWYGSLLDHYWGWFLIMAMTGGAALGAAVGTWGATNIRRPPTPAARKARCAGRRRAWCRRLWHRIGDVGVMGSGRRRHYALTRQRKGGIPGEWHDYSPISRLELNLRCFERLRHQ